MNRPPGFVPIFFDRAGKILLSLGLIGLFLSAGSYLTHLISLPPTALVFSLAAIVIGLYMVVFVPKETANEDQGGPEVPIEDPSD